MTKPDTVEHREPKLGAWSDKGHMWPYHCYKHDTGHGGACASCLKDHDWERQNDYEDSLREEIEDLRTRLQAAEEAIERVQRLIPQWRTEASEERISAGNDGCCESLAVYLENCADELGEALTPPNEEKGDG